MTTGSSEPQETERPTRIGPSAFGCNLVAALALNALHRYHATADRRYRNSFFQR